MLIRLILFVSIIFPLVARGESPFIWDGVYAKNLAASGIEQADGKVIRTITVDPTAGAGVAAPIGSFAQRNNSGAGEFWLKTGTGDTAWILMPQSSSSPGGSDTFVQYNKSNSFFGDTNFKWDYTGQILKLKGDFEQDGSSSGTFTQKVPATITSYSVTWPSAQSSGTKFLQNDGSGNLSWSSNGVTSGNLTDVGTDGITVTGGTGAVLGSGTSLSQHVADASHNGYLSSTDWSTFNGKQSTALTSQHLLVGNASNIAADVAAGGDVTALSNAGAFTVSTLNGVSHTSANTASTIMERDSSKDTNVHALIQNGSSSGTLTQSVPSSITSYTFTWPSAVASGNQVLQSNGSGIGSWVSAALGTVTSVDASVPTGFAISGNPITTSGTLAITLSNASANTVWAGPASGSAAAPTLRAMAAADLPANPQETTNLGVSLTANASALTFAVKQADGSTNASTGTAAVAVSMRSSTATSGAYNRRLITGALSQVITAGTTLGMLASQNNNLWLYAIDSDGAGTMKLGVSTVRLDDRQLQSSVAESFSATATNASPAVFTASAHGMNNNTAVTLTGTPPTGFSTATKYFVVNKAASTFQLSATNGGTAINSSSTGSSIVVHIADSTLVSDAVYTSMPIKLIGSGIFNLATAGTWIAPSTASSYTTPYGLPDFVQARYSQPATGQSIANSLADVQINFDTMAIDTHGAVTTGSLWNFTAPVAGNYQVLGTLTWASQTWAAGNIVYMGLYKNGAVVSYGAINTAGGAFTSNMGSSFVDTIALAKGDSIYLTAANNRTAGASTFSNPTKGVTISITKISD